MTDRERGPQRPIDDEDGSRLGLAGSAGMSETEGHASKPSTSGAPASPTGRRAVSEEGAFSDALEEVMGDHHEVLAALAR